MEKKYSNRQSSTPVKGIPDCKKSDNGNSKFPRQGRKREGYNPTRPKNDPSTYRQSSLQKSKAYDKRPQPRGYTSSGEREEVAVEEAEYGSAMRPGSKKGNWNHLLNFTFAPRESSESGWGGRGGHHWNGRNRWSWKSTVKYNKEQYLQANCQFVVCNSGDYLLQSTDPDALVDWDLIEEVKIQSPEVPSCPICLYPPTAAKITRCGHIYCWSCILHYLSLGEKNWRKCPICYESVYGKDLKSVIAQETHVYNVGEAITMKLMKRERGSTYAMPVSQWTNREGKPHNIKDNVDTQYTKLLVVSPYQVQQLIADERAILEIQMQEEGGESTLEGSYVKAALNALNERERKFTTSHSVPGNLSLLVEQMSLDDTPEIQEDKPVSPTSKPCAVQYASAFDDEQFEDTLEGEQGEGVSFDTSESDAIASPDIEESKDKEAAGESVAAENDRMAEDDIIASIEDAEVSISDLVIPEVEHKAEMFDNARPSANKRSDVFYFYQASDGQQIYIHSLNARCLVKEYGSWENCPQTVTANIVELESISMTEDLRRRLRYLGHLPLTCEFYVAELVLKPPVVSQDTLREFQGETERRRRLRQKKSREEKRHVKKIQDEENRKMGRFPGARLNLSSMNQFPDFSSNDAAPSPEPSVVSSTGSTPFGSPPDEAVIASCSMGSSPMEDGAQNSSVSFAQMLRAGKAKPEAWPKVSPGTSALGGGPAAKVAAGSDESDNEDRVPVPTYQSSFGEAIQQMLDKYQGDKDEKEQQNQGGKKKKKQKKLLLFTTSMSRAK